MDINKMSVSERKEQAKILTEKIRAFDKSPSLPDTCNKERNGWVEQVRVLQYGLPYDFAEGEVVTVKLKRRIQAKVDKEVDPVSRLIRVIPMDHVYSEPFIVGECMIMSKSPSSILFEKEQLSFVLSSELLSLEAYFFW